MADAPGFQHDFGTWWSGVSRQGDPASRPRLVEEAAKAMYVAGLRRGEAIARELGNDCSAEYIAEVIGTEAFASEASRGV